MTPAASGTGGTGDEQFRFRFGADVPIGAIRAGTNLLVEETGVGSDADLLDRLLTAGRTPEEAAVLVSTDGSPGAVGRRFESAANVGLVCCGSGRDGAPGGVVASSVGSPGDLTGIGIQFSKVADAVSAGGSVRVGLDSMSTLLMYVEDTRSVFRFAHAFVGRIAAMDALGVFTVDPAIHADRTLAMLRGLFDGRIQVRIDNRGPALRTTGLPGQPDGWQRFRPDS